MLIAIAGDSGTGKSSMAEIFRSKYNTSIIECDCFHRWERNSENWQSITHLNPDANYIDHQENAVYTAKQGSPVNIRPYHHHNGRFGHSVLIPPEEATIFCGLLPFYEKKTADLFDVKIYIEVEENLRTFMKVHRDVLQRGHTIDNVLASIQKRSVDYEKFVQPQKLSADIIVKYTTKSSTSLGKIFSHNYFPVIDVTINGREVGIIEAVEDFVKRREITKDYTDLCITLGGYVELFQGNGGNISVKDADRMIIKKSGFRIDESDNSCWVNPSTYVKSLKTSEIEVPAEPSIETWFHSFTKKYTVHFHPIHYNNFLCSKKRPAVGDGLWMEYMKPGYSLARKIFESYTGQSVVFLQNHGVIVTADVVSEVYEAIASLMDQDPRSAIVGQCIRRRMPGTVFFPTEYKGITIIKAFTPDIAVILGEEVTEEVKIPGLFKVDDRVVVAAKTKTKCLSIKEVLDAYMALKGDLNTITDVDALISWDREVFRKNQH
jgi:uridine kinase